MPATLCKKRLWYTCFPVKFLRATFTYRTPLVAASEGTDCLPVITLFFWKFYFSLRTFYKNVLNVHVCTFRKRCHFIWGCNYSIVMLEESKSFKILTLLVPILDKEKKGLHKTFWGTTKKCENKKINLIFISIQLSEMQGTGKVKSYKVAMFFCIICICCYMHLFDTYFTTL